MRTLPFYIPRWITAAAILAVGLVASSTRADERASSGEVRRPVFQRRAFDWRDQQSKHSHGHQRGHIPVYRPQPVAPPVSAGWFQRPYPYHLDFYRMRYGGSYAPYFGNLYGPPQVVTAPPYFGPYYGGYVDPAAGYGAPWDGYAQPPIGDVEAWGNASGPAPASGQTDGEAAGDLPAPGSSAVDAQPVE